MKKPLSDIPKSTAMQTMTAIIGFLLSPFMSVAQESNISGTGAGYQPNDTIHAIMPLSDSDEESFFRGVIPPSLQAAALARYAEYPVSHTTGVPDISFPLYEIDLGGYTLPISISYHASGCRVDDVPTSVGLGWCLNAGEAVTRTLHGGPDHGFSQTLHYTDGPGKPLYNGSVSSMTWTMGGDGTRRGYRYTYNGYGWLTLAEYAEGETLSSNKDRYTERFLNFMPNGGIRRLQRHGLKADDNYGKIDNLHISYDGNRITTVLEDAADVTTTGSMDYPGNNRAVVNGTTGAIEQTTAYYPYGAVIADLGTGNSGQPFKFGGKELISANGLNEYDFGARRHYPAIPQFTSIDSKSDGNPWLSPYLYCANNPVNLIDEDGNEWRSVKVPYRSFVWVDKADARDANGDLLPYHYEQGILFTAQGLDGKTFDMHEKFNMGSSTAIVFKADGTTESFDACTNPSNVEKYATVPEGNYEAKVGKHHNKYDALRVSDEGTENFNANSIELGKPNPSNSNTTKATSINIHKPGMKNKTGMTNDNKAISEGCLLIDINKWDSFINLFTNTDQINNKIGIIIQR